MQDLTITLVNLLTADTIDQAAAIALSVLVGIIRPKAACVLLWDGELARYTVGDTWLNAEDAAQSASDIRRRALRFAMQAREHHGYQHQTIEAGIFYQPLNFHDQHIGAYICMGLEGPFDTEDECYILLMKAAPRALYNTAYFQETLREQIEVEADRARLEKLLQAVEQQQHTIDRLLASERQLSTSLEAKVEERTAALKLAQERLIQSEKLAVIGKLASSLAHELNNPLQAIQSGLGLVMDEIDGDSIDLAKKDLSVVQAELERIESIFRQMLDFYRPVSYEYVPLDLNAICNGVRVLMRKRLQEMNVSLHLELATNLPQTCGDSNQIKQVLLNLLLNAAEAMAPGGGAITLCTIANGKIACLSISDTGPGIALQHRAHLFEPLFTTKTRGLGLGLAISQEIVQRHGGSITVDSVPGSGTTFAVHLPVREHCYE